MYSHLLENSNALALIQFGSHARENTGVFSDFDFAILTNGDFTPDIITTELKRNYPGKIDIYVIDINSLKQIVNPKVFTMYLDAKYLWRKDNFKLKLTYSQQLFLAFLEVERLRNIQIFSQKEITSDFEKKYPGGRRSYDEIWWLQKIIGLSDKIKKIPVSKKDDFLSASKKYDTIYLELLKSINILSSSRGLELLEILDSDIKHAFTATHNLDRAFTKAKLISSSKDWLVLYALAANIHLDSQTAIDIANLHVKHVFVHEIKKNLLQNITVKHNKELLKILQEDSHQLVKLYANLLIDPALIAKQSSFIKNNVNHIL
jgi:predicted nucleotidyltransferase